MWPKCHSDQTRVNFWRWSKKEREKFKQQNNTDGTKHVCFISGISDKPLNGRNAAWYFCAVIANGSLASWCMSSYNYKWMWVSFLVVFCLFLLCKLEQISAERFEHKTVLHPAKCPVTSQLGCSSSCGIWSPEADWAVGLWGVLWHMHEVESVLSWVCESNSLGNIPAGIIWQFWFRFLFDWMLIFL